VCNTKKVEPGHFFPENKGRKNLISGAVLASSKKVWGEVVCPYILNSSRRRAETLSHSRTAGRGDKKTGMKRIQGGIQKKESAILSHIGPRESGETSLGALLRGTISVERKDISGAKGGKKLVLAILLQKTLKSEDIRSIDFGEPNTENAWGKTDEGQLTSQQYGGEKRKKAQPQLSSKKGEVGNDCLEGSQVGGWKKGTYLCTGSKTAIEKEMKKNRESSSRRRKV